MHNIDTAHQEIVQSLVGDLADYDITALIHPNIPQIPTVIQLLIAQELEDNHPCGDQV